MKSSSLHKKLSDLKNLNNIGENVLNNCLKSCKNRKFLSFENIEKKNRRSLVFESKYNSKCLKYRGICISNFTDNDSRQFSELIFYKNYFSILNSNKYSIIDSIINFISNSFSNIFYEELKIEILKNLNINDELVSIDFMKAIPNDWLEDFKTTLNKAELNYFTDELILDDVKHLSSNNCFIAPFVSFVFEYNKWFPDYGILTVFPTSKWFYYGLCSEPPEMNNCNLKFLKPIKSYGSLGKLTKTDIVVGNLFNYLLIKIVNKNSKETSFVHFDKFGSSPKILKDADISNFCIIK